MTKEELEEKINSFKLNEKFYIVTEKRVVDGTKSSLRFLSNGAIEFNYYYISLGSIIEVTQKVTDIQASCTLGLDPEFFFVKEGEVIPSIEVIPNSGQEGVTTDGFQGELNPSSGTCREVVARFLGLSILYANDLAKAVKAELNFDVGHIITDPVWKRSPLSIKRFGCNPTTNVHESKFKRVTGLRERFRAGAGHIHVGSLTTEEKKDLPTIVTLMDIVAGNTCVLIDRDVNNARRRTMYGRAGEYRVKSYGVEYRVLSNFWLKHYILWSMASALVRNALGIYRRGLASDLISRFDMAKVRKAINENDKSLAMENFLIYKQFLIDNGIYASSGVDKYNVDKFIKWAKLDNPMDKIKCANMNETLQSWTDKTKGTCVGFEIFIGDLK